MSPSAESINSCQYLYLHEIGEPSDNVLRLVIAEAISSRPISAEALAEHPPELREMFSSSREILHKPAAKFLNSFGQAILRIRLEMKATHFPKQRIPSVKESYSSNMASLVISIAWLLQHLLVPTIPVPSSTGRFIALITQLMLLLLKCLPSRFVQMHNTTVNTAPFGRSGLAHKAARGRSPLRWVSNVHF